VAAGAAGHAEPHRSGCVSVRGRLQGPCGRAAGAALAAVRLQCDHVRARGQTEGWGRASPAHSCGAKIPAAFVAHAKLLLRSWGVRITRLVNAAC
jgi:hypothetical protein